MSRSGKLNNYRRAYMKSMYRSSQTLCADDDGEDDEEDDDDDDNDEGKDEANPPSSSSRFLLLLVLLLAPALALAAQGRRSLYALGGPPGSRSLQRDLNVTTAARAGTGDIRWRSGVTKQHSNQHPR